MSKKSAVIIDLDGTLCNTEHRKHHMESKPKNWKAFYDSIPHDTVHDWCQDLIWAVQEAMNWEVIFVSGRPEEYRRVTELWISENADIMQDYRLFMRPDGDFRKDSIVKEEIYRRDIEPNFAVMFCVDDRKQVVDMWRSIGLTCLQCAPGEF